MSAPALGPQDPNKQTASPLPEAPAASGKDQAGRSVASAQKGFIHTIACWANNTFSSLPDQISGIIQHRAQLKDKVTEYSPEKSGAKQGGNIKSEIEVAKAECVSLQKFHTTDIQRKNLEESEAVLDGLLEELKKKMESSEGKLQDLEKEFNGILHDKMHSTPKHDIDKFEALLKKLEPFKQDQSITSKLRDSIDQLDYKIRLKTQTEQIGKFYQYNSKFVNIGHQVNYIISKLPDLISTAKDSEDPNRFKLINKYEEELTNLKGTFLEFKNQIDVLESEVSKVLEHPHNSLGIHQNYVTELKQEMDKLKAGYFDCLSKLEDGLKQIEPAKS